ncbi:hypothetical protein ACM64Y_14145 [Novispirillum sp. DQ9]|uniref:hypothetical protein n=1 Tax=Novispirillum sp. DQ9 TaxID=3398612 RepID=UPI003C7A8022
MKRATSLVVVAAVSGLIAAAASLGAAAPVRAQTAGCFTAPTMTPTDPAFLAGDISAFTTSQQTVDCFAWQAFIAMNWPVDPAWPDTPDAAGEPDRTATAAAFGLPRTNAGADPRPVVWETFKRTQDVFRPDDPSPPAPWGVLPTMPATCAAAGAGPDDKILTRQAKSAAAGVENPDRFMQATGNWLADQNGELVWYELLTNRAEFEAIVANKWYLASGQKASLEGPSGLALPTGTAPGATVQPWSQLGAMELKAAWRVLTDYPETWSRYYTVAGWTHDPNTGACSKEIFGLAGLHIIQKTQRFNNFMWSTFEQVDNAPSADTDPVPPHGWAFYDADCAAKGTCVAGTGLTCAKAIEAEGKGQTTTPPADPAPIPVKRCYPVGDADQLAELNAAMKKMFSGATGGQSVFQYYQLVNVMWPETPLPPPRAGAATPLDTSTMTRAGGMPVANTSMESFRQDMDCTACHAYASPPSSVTRAGGGSYATDFSFLFDDAYDDLSK